MDKEQIILFAGITGCALALAAYVIWGPSPTRKKKGPIVGLRNLGMTCFLNTVLQSLASCSFFVEWSVSLPRKGNLTQTIEKILRILNGEVNGVDIPYSPIEIVSAIRKHGWTMPHSEHDAHEFFHVVLTSIEEEITKNSPLRKSCLLDVLEEEPSSTEEKHQDHGDTPPDTQNISIVENKIIVSNGDIAPTRSFACINKTSLSLVDKSKPSPFKGFLTSQLKCTGCGFVSPLRYDPFDSISLHLPSASSVLTHYSLTQLLDKFVETEQVEGVECEGCNKNRAETTPVISTEALKTLRFGKLPKCLCFHISRLTMQSNGTTYKRQDTVEFSEYLTMDPYTHNTLIKKNISNNKISKETNESNGSIRPEDIPECKNHLYRLKAVIVHCGSSEWGGHFITYRHGYLRSQTRHRWFYTSDEEVRQTSLAEVLSSLPYMLFYEKCETPGPED
ncbi:ubiquitin carboxyl-terminal hydrolase 30 homolog isoform X2 [Bemisia tabaci]|uniref:ubiquitin carboxyl-terminal hydrolase 30 homolog isoform X2 n=1 Tax=Bemisia tabaci TaxID=7038 RepID=UPI0008F987C9|nr:PREDICTED: ubiquitin carboxyl-terminal hydrolase 30 homolog isoform X2 [Bemisia tabaci]